MQNMCVYVYVHVIVCIQQLEKELRIRHQLPNLSIAIYCHIQKRKL